MKNSCVSRLIPFLNVNAYSQQIELQTVVVFKSTSYKLKRNNSLT